MVVLLVVLGVELVVIGLLIPQSVLSAVVPLALEPALALAAVPVAATPPVVMALPQFVGAVAEVVTVLGPVTLGVVFTAGFDTAELTLVLEYGVMLLLSELFMGVGEGILVPLPEEVVGLAETLLLLPVLTASAVLLSNVSMRINSTKAAAISEEQKVIM